MIMNLMTAGLTGPFGIHPGGDREGGHCCFNYPRGKSCPLNHVLYTLAIFYILSSSQQTFKVSSLISSNLLRDKLTFRDA